VDNLTTVTTVNVVTVHTQLLTTAQDHAPMLDGLVMATVMMVTTTVDADGIVVTAVAMPITTTTVMTAHVSTLMLNYLKFQ
jgi:hypothetical protein